MAKELNELGAWKVGQRVVAGRAGAEHLDKITRITDGRGGTIYIDTMAFDIRGRRRGEDSMWESTGIYPATDRDIKRIVVKGKRQFLYSNPWASLTDDQIIQVYDLVNKLIKG